MVQRAWFQRFLRTPLLVKLVVLDLAINAVALVALGFAPPERIQALTLGSLVVVLVLNAAMVAWALTPLRALEDTAWRVSQGEFSARTHMSAVADRNLLRIGHTLDRLLDRVEADRANQRYLAALVIAAGERERARIARELHDGTAQALSALQMLLGTSLQATDPEERAAHLPVMREIVGDALAEVRQLAHTLHPRVLDDLGLPAALESLAKRAVGDVRLSVEAEAGVVVPQNVAAAVYRVAQEAVSNAVRHGGDGARLFLKVRPEVVELEIRDEGKGFDPSAVSGGMGLLVMRERVSLLGGTYELTSAPGQGTSVRISIPLEGAA